MFLNIHINFENSAEDFELSDDHRGVGLLLVAPLEGEGQAGSLASEVNLLPVAQVVEFVLSLQVVEINPVMKT